MAGQVLSLNSTSSTDVAFRAWGSAISAAFTALGFTKTADTGQINLTTVTAPVAVNTSAGYEIRQFTDTLQATRPIVVKVEYGSGPGSTATPQMWATFGTASDGAGTITSTPGYGTTVSARRTVGPTTNGLTGQTSNCYLGNADGSAIGLMLWPTTAAAWGGGMFAVERTRNLDGTPNGDGFYWIASSSDGATGSAQWQQFVFTSGYTQQSSSSQLPVLFPPAMANTITQTIGADLFPLPVFTGITPKLQAPSQLLAAVNKADLTAGAQVSMTHYGTARTFVAAGNGSSSTPGWGAWNSSGSVSTGSPLSYIMRID